MYLFSWHSGGEAFEAFNDGREIRLKKKNFSWRLCISYDGYDVCICCLPNQMISWYCESQQSLVDLLTSSVFTYCSSFVVSMVTSPFISIVWCFRPYKPYIFWKLIIWWWQWPRQILTKRRRHEIRFYALLGLNIFQGSISFRGE